MLFPGNLCGYGFSYSNWPTTPASSAGTSVVPGASNAEGAWTQIASAANIAQNCYWLFICVHTGATSAASKPHLIDIGVDPAGGTSYAALISNLACGDSAAITTAGVSAGTQFIFPIFIKAGSAVAVRVQGANATAGTVRVMAKFYGQPTNPLACPVGQIAQTFGTITNSNGTSFTPGSSANGTWVSLGTANTPLWWWQVGVQIDNATISAHLTYVEVAVGDATNKKIVNQLFISSTTAEAIAQSVAANLNACACYWPVPAGTEVWIRGHNNAAPISGYNATVIGIGG